MKRILTITEETFGRPKPDPTTNFTKRESARAVVTNSTGEVYLLYVTSHGYHKLPGGGIDPGEAVREALKREILEEVGCLSQIGKEIGEIVEFRHYEDESLEQYSYSFFAQQVGERGEQHLEQGEIDEGHDLVIANNLDHAIRLLENDQPNNTEGAYIRLRDLTILKAARNLQ